MAKKTLPCPVCASTLTVRLAHGRRSGKPFVMLICPSDGRHIRAFINDHKFVSSILATLERKS
ncbi:MAG: hypothetical protein HQ553_06780 [Chloroflexi bacterium]|nr:hypothetical protein [Chloroflexota bacterium]